MQKVLGWSENGYFTTSIPYNTKKGFHEKDTFNLFVRVLAHPSTSLETDQKVTQKV